MRLRTFIALIIGIAIGLTLAKHSEKVQLFWAQFEKDMSPKISRLKQSLQEKLNGKKMPPMGGKTNYSNSEYENQENLKKGPLSQFCSPIRGDFFVTSPFGWRTLFSMREFHEGIDLVGTTDWNVYAAFRGELVYMGKQRGYGNLVILRHPGKIVTKYAHLENFTPGLSTNGTVKQHQRLGRIGNSGRTTGRHLHFEILKDGKPINPKPFLKKWNERGGVRK